jgi:hypothetical protein
VKIYFKFISTYTYYTHTYKILSLTHTYTHTVMINSDNRMALHSKAVTKCRWKLTQGFWSTEGEGQSQCGTTGLLGRSTLKIPPPHTL